MASNTHICGSASCMDTLYAAVVRFGWQATLLVAVMLMVMPNFALGMLRSFQMHRSIRKREEAMMAACVPMVYPQTQTHLRQRLPKRDDFNNTIKLL